MKLEYKIGGITIDIVDMINKEIREKSRDDAINIISTMLNIKEDIVDIYIMELIMYHLSDNGNLFCMHLDTIAYYLISNNLLKKEDTEFGFTIE